MSLFDYPLLALNEAVDYTLDQVVGGDLSPRSRRLALMAVQAAYDEIPARRMWRYYAWSDTIQTNALTTGSCSFVYTGGTYERMLTASTSMFDSTAPAKAVAIAGVRYGIESYKSSTVVTLEEGDSPTSDLSSGTSFSLIQDVYELPSFIRQIDYLYDTLAPGRMLPMNSYDSIMRERRLVRTSAVPLMYWVGRSKRYASSMAVHFAPSCTSSRKYQYTGQRWPIPLTTLDDKIGTVATTANSTTVTGTGTSFSSKHVGCVIRIASDANAQVPTSLAGEIDKNSLNPYAFQGVIKSVTSATSLELEQPCDQTLSTSGYRISSRIDIEPGAMRQAFLRCCEAKFATQDRKGAQEREARYEKALELAMAADQRQVESPGVSFVPHTLADIAASVTLSHGP